MKTIEEYRKQGYKIRVIHYRPDRNNVLVNYSRKHRSFEEFGIKQCGGITEVQVTEPNGDRRTEIGVAICSESDTFNYSIGSSIALGRAIKLLQ